MFDTFIRDTIISVFIHILFSSFIITLLTTLFNRKINKIINYIIYAFICIIFAFQFVMKNSMDSFMSLSMFSFADQAVDLLNNVIGREIGKTTSIDSTSKDIAKKVLDYYYTNGLNIVKETDDGHYVIVKERLSYERYKDDLIILETLDENGFPPDNKYYNKKGD